MPPRRITVLFVDDDTGFLDVVQNLMQTCSEGLWDVLTAQDATRALAVLRDQRIDLMVIDVHMPVMDGVQFLGLLHRKYPNMLKVVLTGLATDAYRASCLSNGAELFLEKPVNREGWENLFTALDELVRCQPEEGFQGVLRRVGLQDVLQMECLARGSSVLDISTAETHGSVFVKDGQIIHAQIGELAGEEAFNHLLSLSGGQFNLKQFTEPPVRSISGSWEFLLMEAARKRDEAQDPLLGLAAGGAVGAAAAPAPRPAERRRPNIDEVLICSTQGDVLYEWQCADANARIRFLQFLSQKSWQLRQGLPLGHFQRLEMEGLNNRVVTHIDPDRALFVRVTRAPGETVG